MKRVEETEKMRPVAPAASEWHVVAGWAGERKNSRVMCPQRVSLSRQRERRRPHTPSDFLPGENVLRHAFAFKQLPVTVAFSCHSGVQGMRPASFGQEERARVELREHEIRARQHRRHGGRQRPPDHGSWHVPRSSRS